MVRGKAFFFQWGFFLHDMGSSSPVVAYYYRSGMRAEWRGWMMVRGPYDWNCDE